MGFLFFVILIVIIVSAANSSKNNKGSVSYQENLYSTPTYNTYNSYYRSSTPKLKFNLKTDTVNLFGYSIINSIFYTCDSKSDMLFAINTKSNPNFDSGLVEGLNYWPNYNQISKTQEELYMLFINIRNVFAEYDETKYLVSENDIQIFMQWLMNRPGAKLFLFPRESIKTFIGLKVKCSILLKLVLLIPILICI